MVETPLGLIKVEKNVMSPTIESFKPLDLIVKITKPKEVFVAEDDLAGIYGDFTVKFLGDETRKLDEKTDETSRCWRLYPRRLGELSLPPIPISLSFVPPQSSESEGVVALIPNQNFKIHESDAPLKSAEDIQIDQSPIRQFPTLLTVLALLIVICLAFITYLFISRGKFSVTPSKPQVEEPYCKAMRRLNELKNSQFYLKNDRLFYIQIDEILREYLANIFILNAQEMTSQEITRLLDLPNPLVVATPSLDTASQLTEDTIALSEKEKTAIAVATLKTPDIRTTLETTVTALDLVKFAKRPTTFDDARQILRNVSHLIENSFSAYSVQIDEARRSLVQHVNAQNRGAQENDFNSLSPSK